MQQIKIQEIRAKIEAANEVLIQAAQLLREIEGTDVVKLRLDAYVKKETGLGFDEFLKSAKHDHVQLRYLIYYALDKKLISRHLSLLLNMDRFAMIRAKKRAGEMIRENAPVGLSLSRVEVAKINEIIK